jgi:hypothetical protein
MYVNGVPVCVDCDTRGLSLPDPKRKVSRDKPQAEDRDLKAPKPD